MNIGKEFSNVEKIVIGVGNILFGDDGFGPKVIEYLKSNYDIKENVLLIDAGTAVREILFDILLSDIRLK
jgi:coenzyme F420 hydrogenase subunit delta